MEGNGYSARCDLVTGSGTGALEGVVCCYAVVI